MPPKDRAAPFSRKHKRYWLPVTGGMVLIGLINLSIGMYLYARRPRDAPRIELPDVAAAVNARIAAGTASDADRTFAAVYELETITMNHGLARYFGDAGDRAGAARAGLEAIGAATTLSVFDAATRLNASPDAPPAAYSALDDRFVSTKDELDTALLAWVKSQKLTAR